MILDATAGNRSMWISKQSDNIIYIDMETKLEVKPTIFCQNNITPFKDKTFDCIFYDPPHTFNVFNHWHSYPAKTEEYMTKFNDIATPRYYGWDKYKTSHELIMHIQKAQVEFYRILKSDGLLWLKWNEMSIPLYRILALFKNWKLLLKIHDKDPRQTKGKHRTYWLCFEKIEVKDIQLTL